MDDSRDSDDELDVESDVDLDVVLSSSDSLPETPVPFWLRTDEDIPDLHLPPSSQDLLVPNEYLLQVSYVERQGQRVYYVDLPCYVNHTLFLSFLRLSRYTRFFADFKPSFA